MSEISYMMHPLPSVFLMELDIPEGFVTQLNEYLDGLLEEEGRVTAADTLVGQISEGEQLRMDHNHSLVTGFSQFLCTMGVIHSKLFSLANLTNKSIRCCNATFFFKEAIKVLVQLSNKPLWDV